MDGVIVDSEEHWHEEEYILLKQFVPKWDREKHKKIMGMSLSDLHDHITQVHASEVKQDAFLKAYQDIAKKIYGHKGKSKPAPDIFLFAAQKLAVQPQHCIVVEDSHNGVIAAKSAGMYCVGFLNGQNKGQDLSKADCFVNSLSQIRGIMRQKEQ